MGLLAVSCFRVEKCTCRRPSPVSLTANLVESCSCHHFDFICYYCLPKKVPCAKNGVNGPQKSLWKRELLSSQEPAVVVASILLNTTATALSMETRALSSDS